MVTTVLSLLQHASETQVHLVLSQMNPLARHMQCFVPQGRCFPPHEQVGRLEHCVDCGEEQQRHSVVQGRDVERHEHRFVEHPVWQVHGMLRH